MRSIIFAILVGLVGAALLHIVIILALPQFTGRDAYTRVLGLLEMDSFFPLTAEPGPTGLNNADPFLRTAVCSFSVADAPARFVGRGDVPFWSLAIFDSGSNEVFSMTTRQPSMAISISWSRHRSSSSNCASRHPKRWRNRS